MEGRLGFCDLKVLSFMLCVLEGWRGDSGGQST